MIHYVVAKTISGYAPEDASDVNVVGVYSNSEIADKVRMAAGYNATITPIEIDVIPKGCIDYWKEIMQTDIFNKSV